MSVRLIDIAADLAREIAGLLEQEDEHPLVPQIIEARIVDRCRCGDDFCATFYVKPAPNGGFGPGHRNVALDPQIGMVVLDIVGDDLMAVEVLYNDRFREALLKAVP